jgi:hypothetical protein
MTSPNLPHLSSAQLSSAHPTSAHLIFQKNIRLEFPSLKMIKSFRMKFKTIFLVVSFLMLGCQSTDEMVIHLNLLYYKCGVAKHGTAATGNFLSGKKERLCAMLPN